MNKDIIDTNEKDFIKVCFNIVAGLEVKNESQAIAKEAILAEVEYLQNNWNELKKWGEKRIENANKYLNDPNENWDGDARGYVLARKFQLEETINKMQELEGKGE